MGQVQPYIPHAQIAIEGVPLTSSLADALHSFEVDMSLGMPNMASIRFADNGDFAVMGEAKFVAGAIINIKVEDGPNGTLVSIFEGEIAAIEAEYDADLHAYINLTAYDKTHRLSRLTRTKSYPNVSHSDIVSSILSEHALLADVDSTTTIFKYVFQDNVTDFEFIEMLARRNGYVVYSSAGKLYFKKNTSFATKSVTLEWGDTLRQFRPRLTLAGQVDKVNVRGWDIQQKKAIAGMKSSSSSHPAAGIISSSGGEMAQSSFTAAARLESRTSHPVNTSDADSMAQGVLDVINAESLEAEGLCRGSSKLVPGTKLKLTGLGARFNGTYIPSSFTHQYSDDGYFVHFRVEGLQAKTMAALSGGQSNSQTEMIHSGEKWAGVYPAIVTNNKPDTAEALSTYASVKLKFPWLSDDQESYWARIAAPGAGNNYGTLWLPEINDEVLVAFEGGDFNRPYVIGGLWNGVDAPPETIDGKVVINGKVEVRTIKTRIGHTIRLTDESGKEKIEIIDGKGKFDLTMDSANEKITLHCSKDILVKADGAGKIDVLSDQGPVNVKTNGNVTVDAGTGNVDMKGMNVNIEAKTAMNIKGLNVSIDAQATATLKGNGPVTVQSSAITAVKGSLVQIN